MLTGSPLKALPHSLAIIAKILNFVRGLVLSDLTDPEDKHYRTADRAAYSSGKFNVASCNAILCTIDEQSKFPEVSNE